MRLRKINIHVNDLEASVDFYTQIMGMLQVSSGPQQRLLEYANDDHGLTLYTTQLPSNASPDEHAAFVIIISVNNESELKAIRQKLFNINCSMHIADYMISTSLRTKDAEGHEIIVIHDSRDAASPTSRATSP